MRQSFFELTVVAILLLACAAPAVAEDCNDHADTMVAEMQASRTAPLSEAEISLIRETALKSCRATSADSTKTKAGAAGEEPVGA